MFICWRFYSFYAIFIIVAGRPLPSTTGLAVPGSMRRRLSITSAPAAAAYSQCGETPTSALPSPTSITAAAAASGTTKSTAVVPGSGSPELFSSSSPSSSQHYGSLASISSTGSAGASSNVTTDAALAVATTGASSLSEEARNLLTPWNHGHHYPACSSCRSNVYPVLSALGKLIALEPTSREQAAKVNLGRLVDRLVKLADALPVGSCSCGSLECTTYLHQCRARVAIGLSWFVNQLDLLLITPQRQAAGRVMLVSDSCEFMLQPDIIFEPIPSNHVPLFWDVIGNGSQLLERISAAPANVKLAAIDVVEVVMLASEDEFHSWPTIYRFEERGHTVSVSCKLLALSIRTLHVQQLLAPIGLGSSVDCHLRCTTVPTSALIRQ